MDDASPPKWHLAHTTWFFETFILRPHLANFEAFSDQYEYLFNSYYNGVGKPFPRPQRGFLSRPTVSEVYDYRSHVDERVLQMLTSGVSDEVLSLVELGLHHEQQHQELMLTDIKYNFGHNPLFPVYSGNVVSAAPTPREHYTSYPGGVVQVGLETDASGFKFDNECPRHDALVHPFRLANRLVSNGEYLEFVQDQGYQTSHLWLSEGWQRVQEQGWSHPLYWHGLDGEWFEYRMDGLQPLDLNLPVVHLSGYESHAFAAWKGARLPTEFEWEVVGADHSVDTKSQAQSENKTACHPCGFESSDEMQQLFGVVWQWTQSSYTPYPGFQPMAGTLGEYNGKFMSSQWVLRGGSCATPKGHVRSSYRNFFYPPDRWQFTGLRLAQDA
ncbi:MAG: ergothioneine biosynthesis protein EgtB [Candidatus Azotimanducaceae bacterium]|jgi:ergothioneine biosynthesis protein EgtB